MGSEVWLNIGGIKIISEMTREELIDEVAAHQRSLLEAEENVMQLRSYVASIRVQAAKERILKEAGLKETGGIFGGITVADDD
jgi:hypothetical protein